MKKIIFAIADYKDQRQEIFNNYLSPRNKKFCDYHGIEYREIKKGIKYRDNFTWHKVFEIKRMLDQKEISDGDYICNIDADMCILKGAESIFPRDNKSFSLAIDNGNTHCWGWISFKVNSWSRNLINQIIDDSRWERLKNTKHTIEFREQAMWYYLAGIMPHSWVPFLNMKNYGWHSAYNKEETYYSLEELHDNVDLRGPEWNTTLLSDEQEDNISKYLQKYNIVKSKKEDTIIRHWAGGQKWNYQEYCSKEIIFK